MVSAARARPYVATPLGVQRARPSLQLDETKIIALVGCHANHVVRRQHHYQRCKRGQLVPRMLCRSTTVFRFGGLPCESRGSQVVPPYAVQTGAIVTPNAVRKHRMPLRTRGGSDASTQSSREPQSLHLPNAWFIAQRCLLQTPLGVQEVTPSAQLIPNCSGIRAAPPDGGADGNTVNAVNRSDRKHRQRLLITMVTRASFNNQYLISEPP